VNVLLMNPLSRSRELEFAGIGLGYLAAGLRQAGHQPDLLLRQLDNAGFAEYLARLRPELIGIKILTSNLRDAAATVRLIRGLGPRLVVVGGPHATGDPLRVLDQTGADFAIRGEADRSFPRLVSLLGRGAPAAEIETIPGLVFRTPDGVRTNEPEEIRDLDALPMPAWDLMPPGTYLTLVSRAKPAATVLTARGCTNRCSFCAEAHKRLRFRGIPAVIAEIRYLAETFGVREIQFLDSNFIFMKRYVLELCDRIQELPYRLSLCAPNGSRVEAVDDEVCSRLAQSGFYRVNIGIESGSPEVLKGVCKAANPDKFRQKVPLFRRHGIQVVGNFMIGFPGETREQMRETLRLALELDLSAANFSIYTPMPGTVLYDRLVHEGRLPADMDFTNFNFVGYENSFSELTPAQLKRFWSWCVLRFLVRPRTLLTVLELARSGILFGNLFQRLYWMYLSKFVPKRTRR